MAVAIILIVVALIVVGAVVYFAVLSPKRKAERRLIAEREQAADRHREVASERHQRASVAEQKAEEAKLEAKRAERDAEAARDDASVHEGRADMHDQGLADHELESGPGSSESTGDRPATPAGRSSTDTAHSDEPARRTESHESTSPPTRDTATDRGGADNGRVPEEHRTETPR